MQRRCPNDNHGRAVVTVRCCPNCGAIVNQKIPVGSCPPEKHAQRRRARDSYCIDCGQELAQRAVAR